MRKRSLQIHVKVGTCLLLLAAIVPYLMIVAFWMERHAIRESMEKKLQATHLVQLTLAEGSYQWVKPNKEIRFDNRLFDVKSFTQQNDSIIFIGLFDDVEKLLMRNFEHFQKKLHKQSRGQLAISLFHFMGLAQPAHSTFTYCYQSSITSLQWNLYPEYSIQLGYQTLPDQPPCQRKCNA